MPLPIDLHEHFINVKRIAEASVLPLQAPGVFRPKLVAPQANGLIAYRDSPFSQQIFNITVARVTR